MAEMAACPARRIEKLLLPTDGSKFTEGAVREAISLAKRCSSLLYVMSVVEANPEFQSLAPGLVEKSEKEARGLLESVKRKAEAEGVRCEIVARQGDEPYKYIVEEAEGRGVDLIVMGRRGRTGLKRLVMGSVTAKVIGYSPVNVLVAPTEAAFEGRGVMVATDGSRHSEAAVEEAVCIAKNCGSALTVIAVVPSETAHPMDIVHSDMQKGLIVEKEYEGAEKNVKAVKALAQKEGVSVKGFVLAGKPYEAIVKTAEEEKCDLIVLGCHGRTGLEKLLMGSVTERVVVLSPVCVLVVKR